MAKTYQGVYAPGSLSPYMVYVLEPVAGKKPRATYLRPRLDLHVGKPSDVFAWGDGLPGKSGPGALLAVSILADCFGGADDNGAKRIAKRFQWRAIVTQNKEGSFSIDEDAVMVHVAGILAVESEDAVLGERRKASLEPTPAEHEGGVGPGGGRIIWDTNDEGKRIREPGAD